MKILLVEDDRHSAEILLQLLAESHYTIDSALSAKSAWDYITTYTYDLIILDIMLPDSNGIDLCVKLRQSGYTIPVLLLTAKDSTSDRVVGLEAGADDYVVKPYNFQELVARIRALLRRYHEGDALIQEFWWEDLKLDLRTNIVTYKQQPLRLTKKECGLLEIFLRHPQQIFSRSALIDRVWSAGECPSDEAVTTHIKGLRQKLKAAGLLSDPIESVYGLGYRLKPASASVKAIAPPITETILTNSAPSEIHKEVPNENLSLPDTARIQEVIAMMAKKLIASLPETIAMFRQEDLKEVFIDSLNNINNFQQYYQNPILTKTGEERMIAWNNTTLHNQDHQIIGTLSIGEDITEKLKVERIKSEFISVASHELRTPLASIRGALGLLASGVLANQPETAKQMLDIASSDTERLVRLVNDILDLERLESSNVTLDRQWYDTSELCRHAVETMQAIANKSQIEILPEYKSFQIFADGDRLVQTLVNLLSNAIKFSPPQSQVQIRIESLTEAIVFHVSDRGRGIPENHLESIFERFNQVDASDSRQMGGTGLGLAICRSIVQQHGGKIWTESKLSEGSTFSFTIPHYRK